MYKKIEFYLVRTLLCPFLSPGTRCKLNVFNTFRIRRGHLLNVILRPPGSVQRLKCSVTRILAFSVRGKHGPDKTPLSYVFCYVYRLGLVVQRTEARLNCPFLFAMYYLN